MRRDLRDVLHDQEPNLFACHPSPTIQSRRRAPQHDDASLAPVVERLQVVRPERRLDLQLRLVGEPDERRRRWIPEPEAGRKPRYRTIGLDHVRERRVVDAEPLRRLAPLEPARRTTRRSPIGRSQSTDSGRSCGGSPPGPRVSTMRVPSSCSMRRRASSARTASSGPSRCAITPARIASRNRSRMRHASDVAHAPARSGRPSRAARRRSSPAMRAAARASSAGEPSIPTIRRAPPCSSARRAARPAAEVDRRAGRRRAHSR